MATDNTYNDQLAALKLLIDEEFAYIKKLENDFESADSSKKEFILGSLKTHRLMFDEYCDRKLILRSNPPSSYTQGKQRLSGGTPQPTNSCVHTVGSFPVLHATTPGASRPLHVLSFKSWWCAGCVCLLVTEMQA